MKYVLDTNTFSALMKGEHAVVDRLASAGRANVAVPQPVLAEIAYGIARLPASRRRAMLTTRADLLTRELARVAWTDDVSEAFGHIKASLERQGERIEDMDVAVAAHAVATDAVLVTAGRHHMPRVPGLSVENWRDSI